MQVREQVVKTYQKNLKTYQNTRHKKRETTKKAGTLQRREDWTASASGMKSTALRVASLAHKKAQRPLRRNPQLVAHPEIETSKNGTPRRKRRQCHHRHPIRQAKSGFSPGGRIPRGWGVSRAPRRRHQGGNDARMRHRRRHRQKSGKVFTWSTTTTIADSKYACNTPIQEPG